jgi:LysM repeat protein
MFRRSILLFAAALALAGCNLIKKQSAAYDDSRNPHYQQAQQDLDAGNTAAAAAQYEAALGENPKLAQAHYELGVLYGDKLNDPVDSIYHFKQYLALAPGSDKTDQVKEEIDKQSQAFAASLPSAAPAAGNNADFAQLQSENATLKKQVADATHTIEHLQAQLSKHHHFAAMQSTPPPANGGPESGADNSPTLADTSATNAPAAGTAANGTGTPAPTPTNVAPASPPRAIAVDTNSPDVNAVPPAAGGTNAAPTGPSRSYTVVKGDSLWKIAHKMYPGDTKNGEDKIRDANKEVFAGKFLKPGQVLVIPQ